jgi:hypothetical protein
MIGRQIGGGKDGMCAPRSITQNYATSGDAAPSIYANQLFYKDCRDIDPRSRRLVALTRLRHLAVSARSL